jgi:hypothetical protein
MSLIRVFKIPMPDGQFVFGGEPKTFIEVDWFRDDPVAGLAEFGFAPPTMATEEGRRRIAEFIKGKRYYSDSEAFLVLSSVASFTINYNVP